MLCELVEHCSLGYPGCLFLCIHFPSLPISLFTRPLSPCRFASHFFSKPSSTATTKSSSGAACTGDSCRRGALSTQTDKSDGKLSLSSHDDDDEGGVLLQQIGDDDDDNAADDLEDDEELSDYGDEDKYAEEKEEEQEEEEEEEEIVYGEEEQEDIAAALQVLGECEDFACVKDAHALIAGRTRFNFPHYFLAGWQKCATTSVNAYLRHHPQYLYGVLKESHWFSQCKQSLRHPNCHAANESQYMRDFLRLNEAVESGLEKVTFDASVDYARKGETLASEIYGLFPWIKIVLFVREPISRVISYSRMFTELGHDEKGCMDGSTLYECLQDFFEEGNPRTAHYDDAMEGWIKVFPKEQLRVIQFEELQEDPNRILHELKVFLGMDPDLPDIVLKNLNNRKAGGFPMRVEEYETLVGAARPHAERLLKMLDDAGLVDGKEWLGRWEYVWNRQLDEDCDKDGECLVNSN